jgi:hypothetical protein
MLPAAASSHCCRLRGASQDHPIPVCESDLLYELAKACFSTRTGHIACMNVRFSSAFELQRLKIGG